jgi:hypothetical protein
VLSKSKTLYAFRCGETGLYGLTTDPSGHNLPSRLYPQIRWRFERRVTLQADRHLPRTEIAKAILHAIAEHGFHLTHGATGTCLELGAPSRRPRSELPTLRA